MWAEDILFTDGKEKGQEKGQGRVKREGPDKGGHWEVLK
jgi:hypothetical protein